MKSSPLSQSQAGVYYACLSSVNDETNYQNAMLITLPSGVDIARFQNAVYEALCAHPYLLSRVALNADGEPEIQQPDDTASFRKTDLVPVREVTKAEWDKARKTFGQTMDIYGERLVRAEIYLVAEGDNYFYFDMHHVISDGYSTLIMGREIERVYNGKKAAGEMMSGGDIALEEQALRADEAKMNEAREWYARTFADAAETDSLPLPECTLGAEPAEISYKHYPLSVTKDEINAVLQRWNVKESTLMQAAWGLLLAAYAAEDKASYCTVFFGRNDRRTLMTPTMMVHTLPVFLQTRGDERLDELFSTLEEQMTTTERLQYYAYMDAAKDLNLSNQVMFVYQGPVFAEKRRLRLGDEVAPFEDLRQLTPGWRLVGELMESAEGYLLKLGYSTADWSEVFMTELVASYSAIIRSMSTAETVRELHYATAEQVKRLNAFNPTVKPAKLPTFVERWKQHVAERPNDIFCVAGEKKLTFAEVDRLTDTIDPAYTVRCGEQVVGFSVPRDEKMALAPLAIAKAGLTQLPLDSSYPEDRLEYMRNDASAYNGHDALVLLYTSGTTGMPKGVILSEENFRIFVNYNVKNIGLKPTSRYATYAGYGFDAYQCDFWSCVWAGATLYIIQDDIRFDLAAINDYLVREGITHCFMTTQMATQMVLNYPDIPGLEWLGTGGEKLMSLDPPTYRLLNAYGPTETSCYVCSHYVDHNEPNIPIGQPNDDVELFIVNRFGEQVPWGCNGELIIAGPQVGLGYLNQPDKTAAAFVEWNGKRVYRTGDIVRYRQNGDIEFVGRKDGQVKIRGFRIELKEVEAVIREFPGIKDATVQAFEYPEGGKFIAAYIVSDEQVDIEALNAFILDQKPPYMVPAVTMQIDAIPLNQNQKVNKRALPKPEAQLDDQGPKAENAPMNVLEEQLHAMVADIVKSENFGITTDLRYVGLSSISAIKLATMVYKRFGVQLDAKMLIKGGSVQTIENAILTALLNPDTAAPAGPAAPADEPASAPLSYSQTGVYFECAKNPISTLYNIPMCVTLPLTIQTDALREAVRTAVLNHPGLFVHFETSEAGVLQIVDGENRQAERIDIPELSQTEEQLEAYKREFVRPFNLSKDLLFRFAICRTDKAVSLLCDIHHLVCDGASYDIFIREICDLLEGKPIEPEMCSYAQFVQEQKAEEESDVFTSAQTFFAERLSGIEGATELSADLTNPSQQGHIGHVKATLDFSAAETVANAAGLTPAAIVLAAVQYTLARFAGNDDVCITTISNGRSNLRVAGTMGMFVNTLALTAKISGQTVDQFVREVGEAFEGTLAHENYPFARIAADYDLKAEIMFAYQMGVLSEYSVLGQPVLTDNSMELNVPKFKIAFYIMPVDDVPSVVIEYDDGLYSPEMMQNLAESVANVVRAFAADTTAPLRAVSLLNKEQTTLLDEFNLTHVDYDDTRTIVSLFRAQAAATPDNTAVVYHDVRYTYKEVDALSDRIAAYIASKGLTVGDVVSVLIPRCEWMVVASLGVLKAGCAYQPLDPSYPKERLNFMMQDANAKLLIADQELRPIVDEYQGEVLLTKDLKDLKVTKAPKDLPAAKPEDLFILLYTSGSTGVPKGCQLEHRNLVAFCHWYQRYYELHAGDKVAAYASYGFDACMMDMYPALTCGATVYIIGDDIRLNLPDLNNYFNEEGITHSFMTTQVGYQFALNCDNHSLRHLSVGGEKLASLVPPTSYLMHNGYGPTECTIFTTTYPLREQEQNIPIGKPLDNLALFIVDKDLNRLPVGAAGELLVSGPQVSRGYLNRPDKTAETYISWNNLRCYRTGDVVRYLPDGNIQFVGRQDGQVKIRGFRIELKEVEAVIREFPGIKDATVQAFDYANGGKFIAAYIVSDEQIDIQALNAFIRDRKPPYMVPAATMQIDAIPLNQNQKVNRKALPAPVIQAADREYVEPQNDNERLFAKIFADILTMDKVGATDNFFELGGTSLMVTRVVIEADKAGVHVAYGDVFANPTPRQLAAFVSGGADIESNENAERLANFDYSAINAALTKNAMPTFMTGERQPLGDVLLTGATGYLGIHVLRELIDSDAKNIYCMVRGETPEAAESRLRTLLYYYFSNAFQDLFGKRLHIVLGDVTQPFDENLKVDTVFNCAANVKHFSKGTDIEDVNVGGAENCVKFCLRTGARLIHVSTTSIGGLSINGVPAQDVLLTEQNLYFEQYLGNQYAYSKFMAERIILDAIASQGLNAKIMRVGNLAARSTDGEFQVNFQSNSYMGRIKVYNMLGCCPYEMYDAPAEFSPINETARAIVLLAATPRDCTVFHPYNNHIQLMGDILTQLGKITGGVRFVEPQEFEAAMVEAMNDPQKAKEMSSLLAYKDMAHGQKSAMVGCINNYTSQVLHRLGFYWSTTSWDYDQQMLQAIAGFGFFE